MSTIYKYNYLSGSILGIYETIKEASIDNNISYHTIYKELHQRVLKYPRRGFYFGYEPKPRYVIRCYDNESRVLLGEYRNIKIASFKTGVAPQLIQWQVERDLDFDKRFMGCTGLWFRKELTMR